MALLLIYAPSSTKRATDCIPVVRAMRDVAFRCILTEGRSRIASLTYLPSGDTIHIGKDRERIRMCGIGGCHGPSNYERLSGDLQGLANRHFTHDECERLSSHGGIDVPGLAERLCVMPPSGVRKAL